MKHLSTNFEFWMNWSVQVVVALATIGAVFAALFGTWFRRKFFPPKLRLWLANRDGDRQPTHFTEGQDVTTRDCIWCHLRVENTQRPQTPATQVQVNLLKIEEPDAAGRPTTTWSGEIPLKWRHQQLRQLNPTIGPPLDCDLFFVARDGWLELQPMIVPNRMKHRYGANTRLFLTVQASSVEGDSNLVRVEVAWDGRWSEDAVEMRRHLVFREAETAGAMD